MDDTSSLHSYESLKYSATNWDAIQKHVSTALNARSTFQEKYSSSSTCSNSFPSYGRSSGCCHSSPTEQSHTAA
ncbi:hypothetical protein BT96DRAFT_928382 [Gymnopus androsaceus JB14]|uniref:Uncharacterized protein n=1 Tax=Gymnopus androsaceus JB14 TaxID=1447944 RepID=A0A6A4GLL0_9AGAR|nr:hypothetical protein BT96DRAFT_928382 [Gymnopus androsaceus JB14]